MANQDDVKDALSDALKLMATQIADDKVTPEGAMQVALAAKALAEALAIYENPVRYAGSAAH